MAKIRVYELARELKMESKVLLAKMKEMGIQVPSHQSTMTSAQIEKIRVNLQAGQPAKVVVRRRRKAAAAPAESSPPATEQESAPSAEGEETPKVIKVSKEASSEPEVAAAAQAAIVAPDLAVLKKEEEPQQEAISQAVEAAPDKQPSAAVSGMQPVDAGVDSSKAAQGVAAEEPRNSS